MYENILENIKKGILFNKYYEIKELFDNEDLYIRKAAYLAVGKVYEQDRTSIKKILHILNELYLEESFRIRQSVIYSCGEIAIYDFKSVEDLISKGIMDKHHSVRNAVIGALKKSGDKNPKEVLEFCRDNLNSDIAETRRILCHSIELRGREHPEEVMDILKLLQYDSNRKVRKMLVHVLGQISYKNGCFNYVVNELGKWNNDDIYDLFKEEAVDVHRRYEKFSEFNAEYVSDYFNQRNKNI